MGGLKNGKFLSSFKVYFLNAWNISKRVICLFASFYYSKMKLGSKI